MSQPTLWYCIYNDCLIPISYIPIGILFGIISTSILFVLQKVISHRRSLVPVNYLPFFLFATYAIVVAKLSFLSREPGSRQGIDLRIMGTWGDDAVAHAYVLENVLMFIPFGILLPLLHKRTQKVWTCLLMALLSSMLIELSQLATQRGFCQLDDVITNTIGAYIGWIVFALFRNIIIKYKRKK